MNRAAGIVFGAATQLLFAFTVWHLFWFLYGESRPPSTGGLPSNAAWAILFAIPHSVLLHPATRKRLSGVISVAFYGCFFCVVTCVT
ncbi:MAG: hypothetical protein NT069_29055, partial [Planctomycetota bacterium]|nr:hypothetical protein [Planctomycetota bacterium]